MADTLVSRRSRRWFCLLLGLSLLISAAAEARAPRIRVRGRPIVLQIGWDNEAREFTGLLQFALHTNSVYRAQTLLLVALWANRTRTAAAALQLAPFNDSYEFYGLFQAGAYNNVGREIYAGAQIGIYNEAHRVFYGGFQLGAINRLLGRNRSDFVVVAQLGLYNEIAGSAYGLAQLGVVNYNEDGAFNGLFQLAVLNYNENFNGLLQLGAVNYIGDEINGAQIGLVNMGRTVYGVQIGLFNVARKLRGVQIGLVNMSRDGGLPFMLIANAGF